ncbi:hypothetical protein MAUB1S_10128 [Mycolicibacterium aubagnense]
MTATYNAAQLYNCCTNHEEPDWGQFDALELGGCRTEKMDDGEEFVEGGYKRSEAEFFTVYGHLRKGGVEAVTDITMYGEAVAILSHLGEATGLPVNNYC